jgi:DsbC/DsbD-like thiol-disulfide interchange protein
MQGHELAWPVGYRPGPEARFGDRLCGAASLVVVGVGAARRRIVQHLSSRQNGTCSREGFHRARSEWWLGFHFELESGWHIYWINPGDSGEPPRVQWRLPTGFRTGSIQWPAPQRIEDHSLVDYGYEGEVLLMVPLQAPAHLGGPGPVKFEATLKWLICREICIPERADLVLSLPVQREGARQQSHWQELFTRTRARLPKQAPRDWRFTARSEKQQFVLGIETGSPEPQATFFPLEPNQIENAAHQEIVRLAQGVSLKLRKSDQLLKPLSRLTGVVELGSGRAFLVDAPVLASNSHE